MNRLIWIRIKGEGMVELTQKEQEAAIAEAPKGTWAILLVYAVFMVLGWLYMFFGYFLPHGPVN
jgi:hypothetical protein